MLSRRFVPTIVALLVGACLSAHAQPRPRPVEVVVAPPPSPYTLDILDERGQPLPTYFVGARPYVLGAVGQRYTVRVANPTGQRIEAVISIDGLDAIDGKAADFVNKRGYVIAPYGELRVEGYRVSLADVAAFRFSSVAASYAARKGQPRNVGVVGVAIFAERPAPEPVYIPTPVAPPPPEIYWGGEDDEGPTPRPEPRPRATSTTDGVSGGEVREEAAKAPAADAAGRGGCCAPPPRTVRPGLGTEFGERRYSPASFTRFERANATVPTALAEVRYNDQAGLVALGVLFSPPPTPDEIYLRETANPFPGSPRYAAPPPNWE